MIADCFICKRILDIKNGTNPYFVKELETGYVVISDFQFYKGYTIFLCKEHKRELHELDTEFKKKFLTEMSLVSEAVFSVFKPVKLNYELLGNTDAHLHWHIIPRYVGDPNPLKPIWVIDEQTRKSKKPNQIELDEYRNNLLAEIKKIIEIKTLKFKHHLVQQILDGTKTVTWRLFDDKNLQTGDILEMIDADTGKSFCQAMITKIKEKKLGEVEENDFEGHERYASKEEMLGHYRGYYGEKVDRDTIIKMIDFKIIKTF